MRILIVFFSVFIFFLTGCNNDESSGTENESNLVQLKADDAADLRIQPTASKAGEMVSKMKEVKEYMAVDLGNKLYVALELKHQYTLMSQKILERIKKSLEEEMPTKKIKVTTDHKIFIELEKLEQKIINDEIDKNKLHQELDKLDKLMKEQI